MVQHVAWGPARILGNLVWNERNALYCSRGRRLRQVGTFQYQCVYACVTYGARDYVQRTRGILGQSNGFIAASPCTTTSKLRISARRDSFLCIWCFVGCSSLTRCLNTARVKMRQVFSVGMVAQNNIRAFSLQGTNLGLSTGVLQPPATYFPTRKPVCAQAMTLTSITNNRRPCLCCRRYTLMVTLCT